MTKGHYALFTNAGVYLTSKTKPYANANFIGGRGLDSPHTISNESKDGTSSLHANPAIVKVPAN